MSAVVPLARRSAQPQRGMERLLRRGVARLFPSYIDPRSLAEAAGATLPLQISDARAVQLVTAGNDRGGLRDRSRPPEPEWLLSAIASSSSSVE